MQDGIVSPETSDSLVEDMSYKTTFVIVAAINLKLEQKDVKTAFLHPPTACRLPNDWQKSQFTLLCR